MQHHIYIFRRSFWGNVLQAKLHPVSDQLYHQGPIVIAVAIAANNCERRTEGAYFIENTFRAEVAQMSDLIRAFRQNRDGCGQAIVRIGQNEYAQRLYHSAGNLRTKVKRRFEMDSPSLFNLA
jgi:hypothetical protein